MKKGKYSYFVEKKALETTERPRKFLEAFAAVLEHSNYGLPLDVYARISMKCSRCAFVCPLYEVTGEDRDIPCHRSELLLGVYRRYFTAAGILKARMFGGFTLTDEYLDRMAGSSPRSTSSRRPCSCRSANSSRAWATPRQSRSSRSRTPAGFSRRNSGTTTMWM